MLTSMEGSRPVWTWSALNHGVVIVQDRDPSWALVIADNENAILDHNHLPVAWGTCRFANGGSTARHVDLGL
jgi:hypothetical protein